MWKFDNLRGLAGTENRSKTQLGTLIVPGLFPRSELEASEIPNEMTDGLGPTLKATIRPMRGEARRLGSRLMLLSWKTPASRLWESVATPR